MKCVPDRARPSLGTPVSTSTPVIVQVQGQVAGHILPTPVGHEACTHNMCHAVLPSAVPHSWSRCTCRLAAVSAAARRACSNGVDCD